MPIWPAVQEAQVIEDKKWKASRCDINYFAPLCTLSPKAGISDLYPEELLGP